jgi:hypothetical protein
MPRHNWVDPWGDLRAVSARGLFTGNRGAELHFLALRKLPVGKSVFPHAEFAAVAEAFEFQAYTIRRLDDLRARGPVLGKPDGPILLDCKVNADIAAPFMGEFAEFETRQHG